MDMKRATIIDRTAPSEQVARAPKESEAALNVVIVYQDSVTRYWAAELWDRMGRLIDSGGICRKSWKIGDLTQSAVFADSVQAAAKANVLIVAVRDAGEFPVTLSVWIDAWVPNRVEPSGGALVAL